MNESLSNIAKPLVNGFLIFKCYLKKWSVEHGKEQMDTMSCVQQ